MKIFAMPTAFAYRVSFGPILDRMINSDPLKCMVADLSVPPRGGADVQQWRKP